MPTTILPTLQRARRAILLTLALAFLPQAHGQTLEWAAVKFFQYNIENVVVTPDVPGTWKVRVVFSVTNPQSGLPWNIKNDLPFISAGASNLTLDIGWDPSSDFTNTGSAGPLLQQQVSKALGTGAAVPVQVRNLVAVANVCNSLTECPGAVSLVNRFWVERPVTPVKFVQSVATGRVALEGRPVCNGVAGFGYGGCPPGPTPTTYVNIPVTSAAQSFTFQPSDPKTAMIADPRRPIVDIAKCKACHDGNKHGDTIVPRLSLHGGNRNENLKVCVLCHNPNQTDVPYRTLTTPAGLPADPRVSGPEVPVDFKTMVHSIHAGGFRETPFVVIGRDSSINDFSGVRFPAKLSNCVNCHIDANGKGTFELPLKSSVLGTTMKTQSVYQVAQDKIDPLTKAVLVPGQLRTIDVDPTNDLRISPTAATCSACHDKAEVRSHMIRTGGASFSTPQSAIGVTVKERCVSCHGPGREEDVRRAHEIRSTRSSGSGSGDAASPRRGGGDDDHDDDD